MEDEVSDGLSKNVITPNSSPEHLNNTEHLGGSPGIMLMLKETEKSSSVICTLAKIAGGGTRHPYCDSQAQQCPYIALCLESSLLVAA